MTTLNKPNLEPSPTEAMVEATRRLSIDGLLGAAAIDLFADVAEELAADNRGNFDVGGFLVDSWPQEELYCPIVAARDRSNRNLVGVHFTPTVFEGKKKVEQISKPVTGQKSNLMLQGMYGALAYITAVEAGLEPKPAALVGTTNPTMAKFAERFGFMSTESYVHNNDIKSPITTQVGVSSESLQTVYKEFLGFDNQSESDNDSEEAVTKRSEYTSHVLKALYEQGHHATADSILALVVLILDEEAVNVFCDYETFKDKTLAFAHQFHKLLTRRAIQEIKLDQAA
jgi:hypothetical protein